MEDVAQRGVGLEHLADELAFGVAAGDDHRPEQRAVAAGTVEQGPGDGPLGHHQDEHHGAGDQDPAAPDRHLQEDAESAREQDAHGDTADDAVDLVDAAAEVASAIEQLLGEDDRPDRDRGEDEAHVLGDAGRVTGVDRLVDPGARDEGDRHHQEIGDDQGDLGGVERVATRRRTRQRRAVRVEDDWLGRIRCRRRGGLDRGHVSSRSVSERRRCETGRL